jgi:L-2-hydroxyglutarate oxidase LhgO
MTEAIDTVVIGAGVVGLAIARALALRGHEVIVLEKNRGIGEETSARNSEVIHAGLYYPAGSLKARLCVEGKALLYAYCDAKAIAYRRCGKLIVAVQPAQRAKLAGVLAAAVANGVEDLEKLSRADIERLEPTLSADTGLWSPSTGIIDSHGLMLALRGDLEEAGGAVAVLTRCTDAVLEPATLQLNCTTEDGPVELRARTVINAAGLHALGVARLLGASSPLPEQRFAKGNYFTSAGKGPFTHLVYPLPEDGGLGIHATLDLAGRVRFGPDVEWLADTAADDLNYDVDPGRAAAFYAAVRSYWPDLADDALSPAYAGIRPKLSGPGQAVADFSIQAVGKGDAPRVVHLFGIESPGLTASLAIGDYVAELIERP